MNNRKSDKVIARFTRVEMEKRC